MSRKVSPLAVILGFGVLALAVGGGSGAASRGGPEVPATEADAARELAAYWEQGGRDRTRISALQRAIGVRDDGIVGPDTTRRIEALGISIRTLPDSAMAQTPRRAQSARNA